MVNLKKFKKYLESTTISKASINARMSDVNIYFKQFNELNDKNLESFVHDMVGKYDSKTIARRVSSLKKYAKFANIPIGDVDIPKQTRKIPHVLSEAEMDTLIYKAMNIDRNDGFDMLTTQVMIMLFAHMIRRQGVLDIRDKDIDFENNVVFIKNKGGDVISKAIMFGMDKIKEYIELKKKMNIKCEYLLVRKYGLHWKRLQAREMYSLLYSFTQIVLGKKVNPHQFRHSIASTMLDHGANLRLLQEMLNHKDISTTQIYTHVSKQSERNAYRDYFPMVNKYA